jgi:hypothetical protein
MATLVGDACIESLQTGKPATVATPTKPDLYGEQEVEGGTHVD